MKPSFGRLCVAIDSTDRAEFDRTVEAASEHASMLKLGLGPYAAFGPAVIPEMAARSSVFVDLKLHDIPMQVRSAAAALADAGASLLTVHASGGPHMVAAAVAGADPVPVVAVTILTSLATKEFADIGFAGTAEENVLRLAKLAMEAGAAGVVASPLELRALRSAIGDDPLVVTPGIRAEGDAPGDQRRTATAAEAIAAGADVIVVGRPITSAPDPASAAAAIAAEVA